jgi:hypothetical protein
MLHKYGQLLLKMAFNSCTIQVVAPNLEHLIDVETFFYLVCIVFILSTIKNLIKLAQKWDSFVIDLVQIIKLTHV